MNQITHDSAPRSADEFLIRGNAFHQMKEFDQAIADYTEAIRLAPKYVQAFVNRGRTYFIQGVYRKAYRDFTEVLKYDPQNETVSEAQQVAFRAMGDEEDSLVDIDLSAAPA